MDKYEFNVKVEQIKKLVMKADFTTAMKIADTIDWHRVRNATLLDTISQVYEQNGEYQEAKEILLQAYERAPVGKRFLFRLAELALMEGSVREAEDYYREFCEVSPGDPRQNLLRYRILKGRGAPVEKLIPALESYVSTEKMDERWLYELAELYSQAGEREKCIQLCDRIILMFGVGDYVEKAMELKVRYAPLSDYQVDLVENKDKYEAKLKAVEEEFAKGPLDMLIGDDEEEEMPPLEDGYPEGDYPEEAMEEGFADGYSDDGYAQEDYPVYDQYRRDEELVANLHQAEAEENLAQEVSKIAQEEYTEANVMDEPTKPLYDIRRSAATEAAAAMAGTQEGPNAQPSDGQEEAKAVAAAAETEDGPEKAEENLKENQEEKSSGSSDEDAGQNTQIEDEPVLIEEMVSNHLSIEARTPERGLQVAIEALKKYHLDNDTHNATLKITGGKLSERGVLNVADKLQGKDLIIEEAGDLSEEELRNLSDLMAEDTSGMVVVLVDNPLQMEELYQKNPEFLQMFEHIDGERQKEAAAGKSPESPAEEAQPAKEESPAEEGQPAEAEPPVEEEVPAPDEDGADEAEPEEQEEDDYDEEMDADRFAEYACHYASRIDCSISGKSMLALYERVELMEEEGIPLTKANAEELIEEAADKAEKPSLGKLITGVFSPKYDKSGLLILREHHFI